MDACHSVHGEWDSWTKLGGVGYHLEVPAGPVVDVGDGYPPKHAKLNTFAKLKAAHAANKNY